MSHLQTGNLDHVMSWESFFKAKYHWKKGWQKCQYSNQGCVTKPVYQFYCFFTHVIKLWLLYSNRFKKQYVSMGTANWVSESFRWYSLKSISPLWRHIADMYQTYYGQLSWQKRGSFYLKQVGSITFANISISKTGLSVLAVCDVHGNVEFNI